MYRHQLGLHRPIHKIVNGIFDGNTSNHHDSYRQLTLPCIKCQKQRCGDTGQYSRKIRVIVNQGFHQPVKSADSRKYSGHQTNGPAGNVHFLILHVLPRSYIGFFVSDKSRGAELLLNPAPLRFQRKDRPHWGGRLSR